MDVQITAPRIGIHVYSYDGSEYDIHDDILAFQTHKDMVGPTGNWTIQLTSKRDSYGRTWAKRIRPGDYVELHGSRTAPPGSSSSTSGDASGQTIVMRGFVDGSAEDIAVSETGNVQRRVFIRGRDYGKVLQKRQLIYAEELNPLAQSDLLQKFIITSRLRMPSADMLIPPTEFLGRIIDILVVDPTIGALQPSSKVPRLQGRTDIPDNDTVFLMILSPNTGSIWNLLSSFEGDPWNELFLRDDDDAPRLYWRRSPIHNKTGVPQWPSAHDDVVVVPLSDVVSEKVETNDDGPDGRGPFCAWFTTPTFATMLGDTLKGGGAYYTNVEDLTDPNLQLDPLGKTRFGNPILRADIFKRYGFAFHQAKYSLFPFGYDVTKNTGDSTAATDFPKIAAPYNLWLHHTESWNPCMEKGSLVLKGNAHVRVGHHLQIVNGDAYKREFYVRSVDHQFSIWPSPAWTTTVQVDRGLWLSGNPYPELGWL